MLVAANLSAQTWADDVACIVYSHCSKCHSPGNIAPFSLMNYQEAYEARYVIQYDVTHGIMPPWKADPNFGKHTGRRLLSDNEINLINAWVNNGAPEGNPAVAPPSPVFSSVAEIQNPDLSVQIPTYTIPAVLTNDLYRVFAIPVTLPGDRFITGMEVIPATAAWCTTSSSIRTTPARHSCRMRPTHCRATQPLAASEFLVQN